MEWISIVHDVSVLWVLWFFAALRLTHVHVAKWQSLGFRLDRFRAFLPTKQGKTYLWNTLVWCKMLLLLAVPVLVILGNFEEVFVWLIWGLLVWQAGAFFVDVVQKTFVRPVYTVQTVSVLGLQVLLEVGVLLYSSAPEMFLYVEVLRPVTMSLFVLLLRPGEWISELLLLRALAKERDVHTHLTVIVVTGSAGKTTTRMYLQKLLASTSRVYTPPIELQGTRKVLTDIYKAFRVASSYDVLILEVHGYHAREVERFGRAIRPDVVVVTTLNARRSQVVGTEVQAKEAVLEILRHVPAHRGLVVLNGDVRYPTNILLDVYARQIVYSLVSPEADCVVSALEQEEQRSRFVVKLWEDMVPIILETPGKHQVMNMVAALACAAKLGVIGEHMQLVATQVHTLPQRLEHVPGYAGALILDDTYGANPAGVHYGLEVLALQGGKRKVLVMAGLEELGVHTQELHRAMGVHIGQVVDECIFYDTLGVEEALREGIQESGRYGTHVQVFSDPKLLREYMVQHVFEGDVILLEHNIPVQVRSLLLEKSRYKKTLEL